MKTFAFWLLCIFLDVIAIEEWKLLLHCQLFFKHKNRFKENCRISQVKLPMILAWRTIFCLR